MGFFAEIKYQTSNIKTTKEGARLRRIVESLRNDFLNFAFCILIFAFLAAGCANHNRMEDMSKKSRFLESAKVDFANWPGRVIEDSKYTFLRKDNITALLLAGGASIAMHNGRADDDLAGNFENHRVFQGFTDESLNVVGNPGTHFAATGLWYALSAGSHDEFNKKRAWTMMTALAVTGLTTMGLKAIRDNKTPNGKSLAWPSGHTASSFCVASVLDEFYGPKVGIPAYILAGLVGYRMMDTGDHWASDVVFGATLGWVVGHSIAGKHKELEVAGFKVMPYISTSHKSVAGVSLVKQF
jgi:membrane-associated phospholipid phosphatase